MTERITKEGVRFRHTTKKEAALRQIGVAVKLLVQGEYEAAITVAGAAEGMMKTGGFPTPIFEDLRDRRPAEFATEAQWVNSLNETLYWLKHNGDQEDRAISEFDAWLMISRALTKYHGSFGEKPTEEADALVSWGRNRKRVH
jgi:hypothetical protein